MHVDRFELFRRDSADPGNPTADAPEKTELPASMESDGCDACNDTDSRPMELAADDHILMTQAVYQEICADFRSKKTEVAGLLVGPKNSAAVTHYLPDDAGEGTPVSFTLAISSST